MAEAPDLGRWPPPDPEAFVRSEAFAAVVVSVVEGLVARYPSMDFSTGVGSTFLWFDRKVRDEPEFLADRFTTPSSFRAYVRQAVWNESRRLERERRRRRKIGDAIPAGWDPVSAGVSAERLAELHEALSHLDPQEQRVYELMVDDDCPAGLDDSHSRLDQVAGVLGLDPEEVAELLARACNRLVDRLGL